MSASHDTDQRLTALEVKISFLEDLTETLNTLAARQQQQIDVLVREVVQWRRQAADGGGSGAMAGNLRDELPPHY